LEDINVELIQGDVLNVDDLRKLISGCETVINCAAIISIHGDKDGSVFRTNTEGPKNVGKVCREKGVKKIIHISSVHALQEHPHTELFDERRQYKTEGADPYDYSKALGEQNILNEAGNNIAVVIVRPSSVAGPYDFKPSEIGKALMDFFNRKIPALPEGGYDFVDVRDVANSIVSAIEKGKDREAYHLTGKYFSMKDFACMIHKVTGKKVPKTVIPYSLLKMSLPLINLYSKVSGAAPLFTSVSIDALMYGNKQMDHSKASAHLGHHARPFEETLRDFYRWKKLPLQK